MSIGGVKFTPLFGVDECCKTPSMPWILFQLQEFPDNMLLGGPQLVPPVGQSADGGPIVNHRSYFKIYMFNINRFIKQQNCIFSNHLFDNWHPHHCSRFNEYITSARDVSLLVSASASWPSRA